MNRRVQKIIERQKREEAAIQDAIRNWPTSEAGKNRLKEMIAKFDRLEALSLECNGGCGGGSPLYCTHDEAKALRAHIMDEHGYDLFSFFRSQRYKL